jgi:hypothetical protein
MSLGQKHAVCGMVDGDAGEVMEVVEVCHGELKAEFVHDVLKKS